MRRSYIDLQIDTQAFLLMTFRREHVLHCDCVYVCVCVCHWKIETNLPKFQIFRIFMILQKFTFWKAED